MFEDKDNFYYYGQFKRYAALFGSLFSSIYIRRESDDQTKVSMMKVPVRYATGNRYAAVPQTDEERNGPKVAQIIPAMSFSLEHFYVDPARQTNKINKLTSVVASDDSIDVQYNAVPYNFEFEWAIRTKNLDDMHQIVEQTLPRFDTPLIIKLEDNEKVDAQRQISIVYEGIKQMDDSWENYDNVRKIDWAFNFTLKGYLYKRTTPTVVIREVDLLKQVGDETLNEWFEVTQ